MPAPPKDAARRLGSSPPAKGKGGKATAVKKADVPAMEGKRRGSSIVAAEDRDLYHEPIKRIVKPVEQLTLTESELKEEVSRVLTANDPHVPNNITKYNFKERVYKVDPPGQDDHLAIHYSKDGCAIHKDSQEAKQQQAHEQQRKEESDAARKLLMDEAIQAGEAEYVVEGPSACNAFNYCERAAQTFNNGMKDCGVATEPPPVMTFSATCTQWEIYDSYLDHYKRELADADSKDRKTTQQALTAADYLASRSKEHDMVHSEKMGKSLMILERMVNQNAEDEIFQDFKYWEDASDVFREGEGSLLPLWRFGTERTKRKQVTAVCWNPRYYDLFAVGYGSYDFMRQGSGLICCFSLKNTSNPEYTLSTESGVMCLDFHPQHPSLLAVGCYDGTAMVFDVRRKVNRPIYTSSIRTGKHTDPVWRVFWQKEDFAKEMNFYSISSDGRVASWIMSKNELKMEPIMQLKLVSPLKDEPEEASISGLAGGCCFDFNPNNDYLFIVGTEEGKIHKCSKAYSGQYLETYEGHHMAVYAVRWNPFHPRVFISCSADWTVKLWDHNLPYPIMSFDLANAVGDVHWSPYSSTVFAAVTSDGKVHVFDLAENKHEPLCEQKVVKRAKITHVSFNQRDPLLIVGDDRGGVNSLKLSPNLRKTHEPKLEEGKTRPLQESIALQTEKIEKLLAAADHKPLNN